ncbi:pilin [Undibacterium sp. Di24W]|uniref:pilin n=1 Tax=Undibacterium sp. Di24W TaxID=3413033 RepID=UPI003BF18D4A
MKKALGFSLLEAMVAVAIIAILAAMAVPSYLYKIVREQIESTMPLTDVAKTPIAIAWKTEQIMPADNAAAGIPVPDKIVSNLVKSVAVENGAIHVTFGNRANGALKDKILTLRPAVIEDAPVVPVTWVCGEAEAPEKMVIKGSNRTTLEKQYLPPMCRARSNK